MWCASLENTSQASLKLKSSDKQLTRLENLEAASKNLVMCVLSLKTVITCDDGTLNLTS